MADPSKSALAPLEALSFRTCVAIGMAVSLVILGLVWAIGPGDADPRADAVAQANGSAADASARTGAEAGGDHDGDGGGDEADGDDGDDGADGPDGDDGAAGDDGADGADGDGADGADDGDADAADGDDGEADTTDADDDAADSSDDGADTDEGGDELVIEDDGGAGRDDGAGEGDGGGSPGTSPLPPSSDPDGELAMTAEELRDEAAKALSEGRYRDASRLATRSYYKKKSNETLVIKGKAACGNKDTKAAKDAVKALPFADDRRKEIRTFCKDRGLRLGF